MTVEEQSVQYSDEQVSAPGRKPGSKVLSSGVEGLREALLAGLVLLF
jgi:hypothetical protein